MLIPAQQPDANGRRHTVCTDCHEHYWLTDRELAAWRDHCPHCLGWWTRPPAERIDARL